MLVGGLYLLASPEATIEFLGTPTSDPGPKALFTVVFGVVGGVGPHLHRCIHSSCLALGRGKSRLRRDSPDRDHCTVVRCIFRPAGLPRRALHFSTGVHMVNEAVSLALTSSSFHIATRNLDRAFRSMADLVIRSMADEPAEMVFFVAARFCWTLLESNTLITRYCETSGKPLLYFEDLYKSKGAFPNLDAFSQRERLEQLFAYLGTLADGRSLGA